MDGEAPDKNLVIITGSYGSGKTEYAINLAARASEAGKPCALVDLDVVNPYFRTRDVRSLFAPGRVDVVAPEGGFSHADLPMLSPRVLGSIKSRGKITILDVGGDPMGARVLGSLAGHVKVRGYSLILVVNTRRPDTRTEEEVLEMMARIEKSARLSITGIVSNTHLMEQTTVEVINAGASVAMRVAEKRTLDYMGTCVLEDYLSRLDIRSVTGPVFVMKKYMKKPWEGR